MAPTKIKKPTAKKAPAKEKAAPKPTGLKPIITSASWVRLQSAAGVPKDCIGMEAVVLEAPTTKHPGGDKVSPRPYESQPDNTQFSVRVRENGRLLMVTRAAFSAVSPDRGGLTRAS
jgi:hypothetical protein